MSEQQQTDVSKRTLLRGSVLAAGAVVAGLVMPTRTAKAQGGGGLGTLTFEANIPGTGDTKVLNYALALEDFESALYKAALLRLGQLEVATTDPIYKYFTEFAQVEADHATYLRGAIGNSNAIGFFNYDFSAGATADLLGLLNLVLQVEATGVRAYLGAIPLFSAGSPYLPTAAAIQGTEARHTTTLTLLRNLQAGQTPVPVAPLNSENTFTTFSYDSVVYNSALPNQGYLGIDLNLSPNKVLAAVSPFFVSVKAA